MAQKFVEINKMRMFDFSPVTVQYHHARILPTRQWMLRDQFPRQFVVVIRQARTHSQFLIFSRSEHLFCHSERSRGISNYSRRTNLEMSQLCSTLQSA